MRRNVITVTFLLISSPSIFMITINNSDHTIFEYRSDPRSYAHYWTSSWIEFFELAWIRLIFFRPYFNYWCSSVHNCEDGFYIRFFNCSAQIWFLYIYSHYTIFLSHTFASLVTQSLLRCTNNEYSELNFEPVELNFCQLLSRCFLYF